MRRGDGTEGRRGDGGADVALIVPVHDVEEYLQDCLDSIEAQTVFDRLEVLVVDDGSTDGSGEIADAFAARHPNVRVVHQPNRGLGAARNRGVALTTAPYVAFVDSDDVLPPRSVEARLEAMIEHDADLVVGAYEMFPGEHPAPRWQERVAPGETLVLDSLEHHPELGRASAAWTRLFRREDLVGGYAFAEHRVFEDAWLTLPTLVRARRVVLLGETVYRYRQRPGSIMSDVFGSAASFDDHLALAEFLVEDARGLDAAARAVVRWFVVATTAGFVLRAPEVLEGAGLRAFLDRCRPLLAGVTDELLEQAVPHEIQRAAVRALAAGPAAVDDPLVSVVVPVHQVRRYLPECLASLETQTVFDRTEVVLVDDGSTDGSTAIATAWAAQHPNACLVVQRRRGAGAARNVGVGLATAPLLSFLDSDDVLPPRSLEARTRALLDHDADVAVGAMVAFPRPVTWAWMKHFTPGEVVVLDSLDEHQDLLDNGGVANKVFRRDLVDRLGLRFPEGRHFEDAWFTVAALLQARRVALVGDECYRYRQHGGSIMSTLFTRKQNVDDHLTLVEDMTALAATLGPSAVDAVRRYAVRSLRGFLLHAHRLLDADELDGVYRRGRALLADADPELVHGLTGDLAHRVPFVAVRAGRPDLLDVRSALAAPFTVRDDGLVLDLGLPEEDLLLRHRVPHPRLARVWVDREQRVLHVEVVVVLDRPADLPLGLDLALRFGRRKTVPLVERPRPAAADGVGPRPAEPTRPAERVFRAEVPLSWLRLGTHRLRVEVRTPDGGTVVRPARPTSGYLRTARAVTVGSRRVQWYVDGKGVCVVRTGSRRSRLGRLRWAATTVAEDLAHVLRRGPLWRERALRLVTAPFFRGRRVWLLGERRDTAQDNASHLFRHLREHRPDIEAYYVIERDAPQRERVAGLGNVVDHGSLRHRLLMLHAQVLVSCQSIDAYLLPERWDPEDYRRHLAWRVGARRVFLQHGVVHNDVGVAMRPAVTGLDLLVTSAPRERDYVRATSGYGDEVVDTGLPRYDALVPTPPSRTVLLMPTWRRYLVAPSYAPDLPPEQPVEGSSYDRFFSELLASPALAETLRAWDYRLEVLPHYEMAAWWRRVRTVDGTVTVLDPARTDVQAALRRCDVLVTDHSSVFFDAAYLGTPVVHAPFDADEFHAGHYPQGWFDPERDGFGPVARTVDEVVAALAKILADGCRREEVYEQRAAAFFSHRDGDSCARVVAAVERVLATR